jgi:integrase/recombinase XerD
MAEGLTKQAKTLSDRQIKRMLAEVATHRYPERDRAMVLLSVKAGLRAKEIAMVTWGMVTDAEGNVGDASLKRRQQGQERRPHGATKFRAA